MEYYSAIKNNKIMVFAGKWMKLENIMQSEISQSQKTKGGMILLIDRWWYKMGGGREARMEEGGTVQREKWGRRGGGEGKNNRMNQTLLPYVNVWLHKWYAFTSCTNRETTCIPLVWNKNKFKKQKKNIKYKNFKKKPWTSFRSYL